MKQLCRRGEKGGRCHRRECLKSNYRDEENDQLTHCLESQWQLYRQRATNEDRAELINEERAAIRRYTR